MLDVERGGVDETQDDDQPSCALTKMIAQQQSMVREQERTDLSAFI